MAVLICLCAGSTLARPALPQTGKLLAADVPIAVPPNPLHLAALEPADLAAPEPPLPAPKGPFGLTAIETGPLSARWDILQPVIRRERLILAKCRDHATHCPAAAAKFNVIIAAARVRSGRARVGEVNRAINLAIRPESDLAQYGLPDVWSSPLETFGSGAGDCEDYAIAKYVALSEAGVPASDLRLVIVHDRRVNQFHMVAAARIEGRWLILDNRTMRLVADSDVPDLTPLAVLGGAQTPTIADTPAPRPAPPPAKSAKVWNTAGLAVLL
ncbi:MAG: transglutaminase-like cysteine peptidase [Pseudolabrys sp.]